MTAFREKSRLSAQQLLHPFADKEEGYVTNGAGGADGERGQADSFAV
jgi:hypothetical protein